MSNHHYELYRESTVGQALTDTLDEFIQSGHISPQLALRILSQFDKTISDVLAEHLKTRTTMKGHLFRYNYCDDVWTFIVDDCVFKLDSSTVQLDRVKVVACNSRKPGEAVP